MTPLGERIAATLEGLGPISVSDYMALCLSDPAQGYYMARQPFGQGGDFTTAPEISQMFGELVGAWTAATWRAMGATRQIAIVEIGPGRGTLMRDIGRTLSKIAPDLHKEATYWLIETSPRLREIQAETLAGGIARFEWRTDIDDLPATPTVIVANELFDALPVRQYVKTEQGWRERMVRLGADGKLAFAAGLASVDRSLLPAAASTAADGAIVELAPARSALMQRIAERLVSNGGAGLFIDYGYREPAVGDTLQALRRHAYVDPLANPGEDDLTAHVDFSALADIAVTAGLRTHLCTQGEFLLRLGLLERAGALGANGSNELRERLTGEVERLASPAEMGDLFKVLAISTRWLALPGFDGVD